MTTSIASSGAFLAILAIVLALVRPNSHDVHYHPRPYTIDVSPSFIHQTRLKAANYRHVADISAPAWFDGPPTANISNIAQYMASDYDWFKYQDAINANFSHFMTTIPGINGSYPYDIDIHFIHQKSKQQKAIPILLLHGWPSTSLEWEKVIRPLANPANLSKPAFHVVAPDLPGYGFSPAPRVPGIGSSGYAAICASLMQQLGYESYAIYSTDLGFAVALQMVEEYEEKILNHVTDFYLVPPAATDSQRYTNNETTYEESQYIASMNAYFSIHSAYASVDSIFPLSISYALNDSPIGFLAWMWQLDFTVRDQSSIFTMQELVSQMMTLFIPGVYGNIRSYKELFPTVVRGAKPSRVATSILQWGYCKPGYPELASLNFVVSHIIKLYAGFVNIANVV